MDGKHLTSTIALWCGLALLAVAQVSSLLPNGFTTGTFEVDVWAANVSGARGLVVDDSGDLLVVATRAGGIFALWEEADGQVNRTLIVNNSDLNHGIALYGNHLYASSPSTVWRWNYTAGQRREAVEVETVVQNISFNASRFPVVDGHQTRSLAIASDGVMYVSVGSESNIDSTSFRARIRSFNVGNAATIPSSGYDFINDGADFASGLRNEVGLGFDGRGRLWGVENGADQLVRSDLGGDIHDDNPAEELNLFDGDFGTFYGYPFCWSEYLLSKGDGPGSQWAWPTLENDTITDEWCKNVSNVRPPELAMQAHSAPLGITFFNSSNCGKEVANSSNGTFYSLSCDFIGDAFVAFHGSWNRDVPVGFKVVRIEFNETSGLPISKNFSSTFDIFGNQDLASKCDSEAERDSCIRPVDLKFDQRGVLFVTSDATSQIIRVMQTSPPGSPPPGSAACPRLGSIGGSGVFGTAVVSLVVSLLLVGLPLNSIFGN